MQLRLDQKTDLHRMTSVSKTGFARFDFFIWTKAIEAKAATTTTK